MKREQCKTILQLNKNNPNGVVGEKIILALKLSEWYRGELTNRTSESWHKGDKIEKVLMTALNEIEKLLILEYKKPIIRTGTLGHDEGLSIGDLKEPKKIINK